MVAPGQSECSDATCGTGPQGPLAASLGVGQSNLAQTHDRSKGSLSAHDSRTE